MTKLFIYGSLKRGFLLHRFLEGQKFLGEATTQPKYKLLSFGVYPELIQSAKGNGIKGEVWEVDDDCLADLDQMEGSAGYRRMKVELVTPFHNKVVMGYITNTKESKHCPDCGTEWKKPKWEK